jgi:hypothetical protein
LVDDVGRIVLPTDIIITDDPLLDAFLDRFGDLPVVFTRAAAAELDRFERVVTISANDESALVRTVRTRGMVLWEREHHGWWLTLTEIATAYDVVLDAVSALPSATVALVRDEQRWSCPWNGEAFQCGAERWQEIRPATMILGGQPHRCIWTHPIEDAEIEVRFPVVPSTAAVVGWYGVSDYAASVGGRGRIVIEAEMGSVQRRFRLYGQRGRRPLRMETTRADDEPLVLRFSTAETGVRHVCWNVQLLSQRGSRP